MGWLKTAGKKIASGIGSAFHAVGDKTFKVGQAGYAKAASESTRKAAQEGLANMASRVGEAAGTGVMTGASMLTGMGDILARGFDYNPQKYTNSLFGIEMTKGAYRAALGVGLVAGSIGAYNDYEVSQMGMPSGEVASPTPAISYTRFGEEMGATGDLVFAMNRNRRG